MSSYLRTYKRRIIMIIAIDTNLQKGKKLLLTINNQVYCNKTIAPYYASIGSHIRHSLDVFSCVFKGIEEGNIDLSFRDRNIEVEEDINKGLRYFEDVQRNLQKIKGKDLNQIVFVNDDLGIEKVVVQHTLGSVLLQAHNHVIHHYASIGYIMCQLGVDLTSENFGYNPTTPKK